MYIACSNGDIRLNGNALVSTSGRIEICNNNLWGTVCDNGVTDKEAVVACRQLGYSTTGKAEVFSHKHLAKISVKKKKY